MLKTYTPPATPPAISAFATLLIDRLGDAGSSAFGTDWAPASLIPDERPGSDFSLTTDQTMLELGTVKLWLSALPCRCCQGQSLPMAEDASSRSGPAGGESNTSASRCPCST